MKKALKTLIVAVALGFGLGARAHALTGAFVQITTSTLQPGTTNGFYVSSGTANSFNTSTCAVRNTLTVATETVTGTITSNLLTVTNASTLATVTASSITATGTINANTAGSVFRGTTDGSSAAVGNWAETISVSCLRSAPKTMATNVVQSIATMTYTAGDWQVSFCGGWLTGTGAPTAVVIALSLVANTLPGSDTQAVANSSGELEIRQPITIGASDDYQTCAQSYSFKPSSSGTLYLVSQVTFPSGTTKSYGSAGMRKAAH